MKKKRKRLLQEPQWSKDMDEKSDEKIDKIKSETDEEKDPLSIDDESQGDSSESKVGIKCRYSN